MKMKMNKLFIKNLLLITLSVFFILPILLSIFGYNNIYEGATGTSEAETPELTNVKTIKIEGGLSNTPIHIREIKIFNHDNINIATSEYVNVSQSSTLYDDETKWSASNAIDDDMETLNFTKFVGENWLKLEFKGVVRVSSINKIVIYNRDHTNQDLVDRLNGFKLSLYDNDGNKFEDHEHTLTSDLEQEYIITAEAPVEEEEEEEEAPVEEAPVEEETPVEEEETNKITCNANYGSIQGDRLCCGQSGVVNKTSRVCPYEYPNCRGFVCGEKWGLCN